MMYIRPIERYDEKGRLMGINFDLVPIEEAGTFKTHGYSYVGARDQYIAMGQKMGFGNKYD